MLEIKCKVTGRVQMVMYRDFVCRKARSLGLNGFVRNEPDGSVTVIAQGDKASAQKLIELLKKGSILAKVEGVQSEWMNPDKIYNNFKIDY